MVTHSKVKTHLVSMGPDTLPSSEDSGTEIPLDVARPQLGYTRRWAHAEEEEVSVS